MKYATQPGSWKRTLLSTTTAAAMASGPFDVPAAQATDTVIKAINSADIKAGHTVAVVGLNSLISTS